MACAMRLNPARWFTLGVDAHAWRASMGNPRYTLHFARGKGWRMQLHLEDGAA